jgi:hypothetical protein
MWGGFWEVMSQIVTVFGLPLAIYVFFYERGRALENDEEEVYQLLSDNYQDFLKVALENTDLRLFSQEITPDLTDEQRERMLIIFNMLISLFERAYLLLYEPQMTPSQTRRWSSWEDYMREWCRRADFRANMPALLQGEDRDFAAYLLRIMQEEPERATGSPLA